MLRAYKTSEAVRARDKARYQRDRKKRIALQKAYANRPEQKARLKTYMARYRAENVDKIKSLNRAWYLRIRDRHKAQGQAYRARKRGARVGLVTPNHINARIAFYGSRCAYCGGPYEHLDHVIPLARGGKHCPANLRPACAPCNLSKKDKLLKDWLASRK